MQALKVLVGEKCRQVSIGLHVKNVDTISYFRDVNLERRFFSQYNYQFHSHSSKLRNLYGMHLSEPSITVVISTPRQLIKRRAFMIIGVEK